METRTARAFDGRIEDLPPPRLDRHAGDRLSSRQSVSSFVRRNNISTGVALTRPLGLPISQPRMNVHSHLRPGMRFVKA
jgi:hypothetical protein